MHSAMSAYFQTGKRFIGGRSGVPRVRVARWREARRSALTIYLMLLRVPFGSSVCTAERCTLISVFGATSSET